MGNREAMGLSVLNEETCMFFKLILAEILRNESITIHCYLAAPYMFHHVLINENTTTPTSMGSKNKLLNTRTQTLTQVADGISKLKLFGERIGRDFPSRLRPSRFGWQLRLSTPDQKTKRTTLRKSSYAGYTNSAHTICFCHGFVSIFCRQTKQLRF